MEAQEVFVLQFHLNLVSRERENGPFRVLISFSFFKFQNFMKIIWLDSLLRIEGDHHPGFVIWKHFKCILKMGMEDGI